MGDEQLRRVERIVTTHDVTWLLDLHKNDQLNLDPAYQRKSVWTPKDRRFFMDTVFRNYPSPAIFLHKTIDDSTGTTTYHVVDGKQRILTILMFVQNRFSLADDFGDSSLDGKRWRDFNDEPTIKRLLWNYRVTVEELDDTSVTDINDVFSRLNKNANKLNPQELRHARFDGWLITYLEEEAQAATWKAFKIRTAAKERRMTDVQNLSELATVIFQRDVVGFSQEAIDQLYAEYDDPSAEESEFDTESFVSEFVRVRSTLEALESTDEGIISSVAQPFFNFYTLWAVVCRHQLKSEDLRVFAARYRDFMDSVRRMQLDEESEMAPTFDSLSGRELHVARYKAGSVGATTEEPKRRDRLEALEAAIVNSSADED